MPQSLMLCDEKGKLAMDYIARYEEIQASYDYIAERVGTPSKVLVVKNSSKHEPSSFYYKDKELFEMVKELYELDFDLLGYDRDKLPD